MNREELEEMFNEKFDINSEGTSFGIEDYTKFVFDTIISEVLKSLIPEDYGTSNCEDEYAYDVAIDGIIQKAKELYGIDL